MNTAGRPKRHFQNKLHVKTMGRRRGSGLAGLPLRTLRVMSPTMEDRHGNHLTHLPLRTQLRGKQQKKKREGKKPVKTHFLTVRFCHSDNIFVKRTVLTK